jgi:hypothetical protein
MIKSKGRFRRQRINRIAFLLVLAGIFLLVVPRLPAPISEIPPSPTPATTKSAQPKAKANLQSKSSQKNGKKEREGSGQHIAPGPLAGTWIGDAKVRVVNGDAYDGMDTQYIIRISDDEKIAWIKLKLSSGNWAMTQSPCLRNVGALTFSYRGASKESPATFSFRMQINGSRTALLKVNSILTGGEYAGGTTEAIGTLTKQ